MKFWLIKTEPETWSWKQQVKSGQKGAEWSGVRNFQAAKNLKNIEGIIVGKAIYDGDIHLKDLVKEDA